MAGGVCVKGIMFNLLEDVLGAQFGPAAWDQLLVETGTDGVYASLGTYPDQEFNRLIDTAARLAGCGRDDMLRLFGTAAFPRLVERYPNFLHGMPDARTFLLSINRIVHMEVRKLYAGAGCPQLRFAIAPKRLRIGYASPRQLCALAEGLIHGVAQHFGEQIELDHPECIHRGDAACRMDVTWPS